MESNLNDKNKSEDILKKLEKFDKQIEKSENKILELENEVEKLKQEKNKFFIESLEKKGLSLSEIFKTLSDIL